MLLHTIIAALEATSKAQGYCALFSCSVIMKMLLNICFENEVHIAQHICTKVNKSLCTFKLVFHHGLLLQEMSTADQ